MTAPHLAAFTAPRARLDAVECLRVVGSVAVIVIHATPFNADGRLGVAWNAATMANQLARFAVPAFFVLAGFFWGVRVPEADAPDPVTRRMVARLLLLFAAWSLVYVLPFDGALFAGDVPQAWLGQLGRNARWIATHPGTVLLQGTNGHLWFLPALASAVALAAVVRHHLGWGPLVAVAALAGAYALLAHPYARTPVGITVPYNARNGPAFALPCVVAGMALARRAPSARWVPLGAALLGGGALLSVVELTWLRQACRVRLTQDYVAGTFAVGAGVALVALANPVWLRRPRVAALGPAVLGIYLVHPMLVDLLHPVVPRVAGVVGGVAGDVVFVAAVFALSLGLTRLLAHHPRTRWLVSTR